MTPEADWATSSCWMSVLTLDPQIYPDGAEPVIRALCAREIGARPTWIPLGDLPPHANAPRIDGTGPDDGAGSDPGTGAHHNIPTHRHAWSDMRAGANLAVIIDRGPGVDNHMGSDLRTGVDHGARIDEHPIGQRGRRGDDCAGMADGFEAGRNRIQPIHERRLCHRIADRNMKAVGPHEIRIVEMLIAAKYRRAGKGVPGFARSVQQAIDRQAARLSGVQHNSRIPAGTDQHKPHASPSPKAHTAPTRTD